MRMAQFYGLNPQGRKLVLKKIMTREIGTMILPDGKKVKFNRRRAVPVARKQVIGDIKTLDPSVPLAQLHRYTLHDGTVLDEFVQEVLHNGGPMYFLALRRLDGTPVPETLWAPEVMEKY